MDPAKAFEAAALAKQKPIHEAMAQGESEVQKFYNNSVIFLTGGSGFLGKQLIEKLFRSCQISKLYLLLRTKKGVDVQTRLQEILRDPLFDTMRKEQPQSHEKIIAVEGNVAELKLGIQENDWNNLVKEVNVIFHVAATTKFDENLQLATLINVRGTKEALLLGQDCKRLRSYVHVSTAFSHSTEDFIGEEVKEEFYKCPIPPEIMISMAETLDLRTLNSITSDLIKGWPNTYTFTKAIAEEVVRTSSVGLPICVLRPVIVLSTYRDSNPGWLDKGCIYGGISFMLTFNIGLAHVFLMNTKCNVSVIPCDYVNNAIIVAGKENALNQVKGGKNTKIYTVSSNRNLLTYGKILDIMNSQESRKLSSPKSIYYNFAIFTSSKFLFRLLSLYFHDIPANVVDLVCFLTGNKRRFAAISKKYHKSSSVMNFVACNSWDFPDENLENLYNSLSKQDKTIFNFDVNKIDWKEYFLIIIVGLRKYIYKDQGYGVWCEKTEDVKSVSLYFCYFLFLLYLENYTFNVYFGMERM